MHRTTKPKWAIYVRVSTRHQAEEGFSLDDQRETLTAYADDRSWDHKVFEDPGVSGETLDGRPGMVALLDAADRGEIVGVLVVDESRLARDEFIAALIHNRLKQAGVKVATPTRGEYDLTEPADNFAAKVLAAAHAFEQDMRTAKMRAGKATDRRSRVLGRRTSTIWVENRPCQDGSGHKHLVRR